MRESGNQLLTAVHGAYQSNGIQAPAAASQAGTKQASAPASGIDPRLAAQAGFELAGLVNGTWDKKAADAFVQGKTVEIIKQASDRADLFIHYANNFIKAAEGEGEETPDPTAGAEGGGKPPAPGGEAGGGEGDMMAALGGGEGADAGGGMGGAGGMGGGAGGGEDPEAIELAHILASLGVTPEQLEQAMAQQAAGGAGGAGGGMGGDPMGGGGAPPPGGGGDPMAAMGGGGAPPPPGGGGAPPPPGMEVQAAAGARKQPATMTAEKKAAVKSYITEIISRSRR